MVTAIFLMMLAYAVAAGWCVWRGDKDLGPVAHLAALLVAQDFETPSYNLQDALIGDIHSR